MSAATVEETVTQLAMFQQRLDATEHGIVQDGVAHPTWDELDPIDGHAGYLRDARLVVEAMQRLGWALTPTATEPTEAQITAALRKYETPTGGIWRREDMRAALKAAALVALPETPTTDDREASWGDFRDGPDYQPTDRYDVRSVFEAGFDAARRPSPPTEEPQRTVTFANEAEVEALFVESGDFEMAFVNAINDHLIVGLSEDGECFYQGFPEALNEEGTKVDPRRGWLRDLSELEWPLTLMVKAEAAARVGGEA